MENFRFKFRAWDKDKNRMSLPFSLGGLSVVAWGDGDIAMPLAFGIGKDRLELMQYTGLKDKNDVEIYEFDLFHCGDINIKYIVEWKDCGLVGRQIRNQSTIGLTYWKDTIQVIGNIYENPELLD